MILARGFSRFVLDLDGVVWIGDEPIPGSVETIKALRESGRRFAFCTNNSSVLPDYFARKLSKLGAGGDPSEIITSAHATMRLLEQLYPSDVRGRTAFVIGGSGLRQAIEDLGMFVLDGPQSTNSSIVAVGLDPKLTYEKLRIATLAIRGGASFIASNDDATFPAEEGMRPGAGAIVSALRTSTGAIPHVAGKPKPYMLELAAERLGGAPALVIGDRIDTDVLAARAMGWPSALVLTGATSVADLAASDIWPDAILRNLSDLLEDLPHSTIRPATGPDLPAVAQLMHEGGLQAGNVRERAGRTVVAEAGRDELLGTAAWDPAGEAAIVRSVAVSARGRRKSVGLALVAGALRSASKAGVRDAYLVTADAQSFFKRCGFVEVGREDLPEEVADHPQLTRECPSAASVMKLSLPARTS